MSDISQNQTRNPNIGTAPQGLRRPVKQRGRAAGSPKSPFENLLAKCRDSCWVTRTGERRSHRVILTAAQIEEQWKRQSGRCYWLGIALDLTDLQKPSRLLSPSIDRLNPKWGYFPSNIVITSRIINVGRGNMSHANFSPQAKRLKRLMKAVDALPFFVPLSNQETK